MASHPYYPLDAVLPDYQPSTVSLPVILALFGGNTAAGRLVGEHTLFAMLWKEYALSDSRYLTGDVFTLCIEHITVFLWGPLSLLTTIAIIRRSPTRHFLQVIVCTAHLYGVMLYYATNWADHRLTGVSYSRPEFLYYWVYYVGFNAPWFCVPLGKTKTPL
ncbi:Emopamil-binding protein [Cordyceps fumosorosea ARSEF 2679]|uniref:Emopamil-binding protein n=1 Tax=Cordyceps fumosorosea (strain ARSEF 2679) TaxID=1081104 RepID=A0A167LS34_CORFA|nr:Emopamil-binding protein [Cordyceps fumosorosea ARSEF 2679]OAA53432.1 Emopamil-binding protein [Cordyceps fumosorosea ARSEF 2679]